MTSGEWQEQLGTKNRRLTARVGSQLELRHRPEGLEQGEDVATHAGGFSPVERPDIERNRYPRGSP